MAGGAAKGYTPGMSDHAGGRGRHRCKRIWLILMAQIPPKADGKPVHAELPAALSIPARTQSVWFLTLVCLVASLGGYMHRTTRSLRFRRFGFLELTVALAMAYSARDGFAAAAVRPRLALSCQPENDLYRVLVANRVDCARFDTPQEAVAAATEGAGVLILADGYPERTTDIPAAVFDEAVRKKVRLYVEFPAALPGIAVGAPKDINKERGVVTSDIFGAALPLMGIVTINGCHYVPIEAAQPHLVLAKVAGVDVAVFRLRDTAAIPVLFDHPRGGLLVATTKLSHFVTGRYMPAECWGVIWRTILGRVGLQVGALQWTPTVRPTYGRDESLAADAESRALARSADWIIRSRVLRHPQWPAPALKWSLTYNTLRDMPRAEWSTGDGSFGVLEGFSSSIRMDGSQPMRYAVRNDCMTEVAMLMALEAATVGRPQHAKVAREMLDYDLLRSGLALGSRADPKEAAYGLLGWALDSPESYWGDDNARAILAMGATSASLQDSRWNAAIVRCILGNFRTTGVRGYREECIVEGALRQRGWESYWRAAPVKLSPHFESWLWACFCWAYDQTRFEPLLARSRAGARELMAAYPRDWFWCVRSGTIERARALLPLAWLVRVDDTPEHRDWLRRIAVDLVALQDPSGAIRETIGDGSHGTASNAEYGTQETSLIQTNGDPISDSLYTCNFALIGLHEAAAATGDPFYAQAEDRLAGFLCRIQIASQAHPELDGAWYRAFDFRRWEYWASNADWEWGPWCMETGWTQPWIAGTLALRQQKTSLWELMRGVRIKAEFERLRPQMLPDATLASRAQKIRHAALGKPVALATRFAPQYSAAGPAGLTDGELGTTNYLDGLWQGYQGVDLAATIDLGDVQPVTEVRVRFLQDTAAGIFVPSTFDLSLSQDGKTYERVAIVSCQVSESERVPLIKTVVARAEGKRARYVQVQARNRGELPAGKPAADRRAWLFVDEIMVNLTARNETLLPRQNADGALKN